jgi:hypothetical protein
VALAFRLLRHGRAETRSTDQSDFDVTWFTHVASRLYPPKSEKSARVVFGLKKPMMVLDVAVKPRRVPRGAVEASR